MTYLFQAGKSQRVIHVARFNVLGKCTWRALCGIDLQFNRTCNLPLGRRTCATCLKLVAAA